MSRDYDLVVIGTGSAGLTAAKGAAQYGAKVAMVDKLSRYGGDCTWYGCVPSKALIRCATAVHEVRNSARFGVTGVDVENVKCDWPAVQKHIRDAQRYIYHHDDSPKVLQDLGVVTIQDRVASFIDPYTLKLEKVEHTDEEFADESTETRDQITADTFIIATGAGPWCPPIPGLNDVPFMTYENIFEMKEFPESLLVMGGGPIGAELAQAFRRLGSEVTSIDVKLLEREDDDVREVMQEAFQLDGIKFVSGLASKISKGGKGIVVEVTDKTSGTVVDATGTHLLVAVGRRPRGLEALNLDKAGVKWKPEKGPPAIPVDINFRTNVKHIFATGDCIAGGMQFTHLAGFQAGKAAFTALQPISMSAPLDHEVPRATFTHPEVATVGYTYSQAVAKFGADKVHILKKKVSEIDRAVCEGATEGFVKIVYNDKSVIIGATVVANIGGEMATELGLAVSKGMTLKDVGLCIHAYPTWAFGTMQMCAAAYTEDAVKSPAFGCMRRLCCARRLRGNSAPLNSVELHNMNGKSGQPLLS